MSTSCACWSILCPSYSLQQPSARWGIGKTGMFHIESRAMDPSVSDAITITYGPHRGNQYMFHTYGFVMEPPEVFGGSRVL